MSARPTVVHPSAYVDPSAQLGEGVEVGFGAYVGPECVIGAGTRLRPLAVVSEHTVMGERNDVYPNAVLGGDPQDKKFNAADPGRLIIGDGNIFREGVTINRGAGDNAPTRIGSNCFLMACSHVGHNAQLGDGVIFANNVSVAGHTRIGSGCFFSAGAALHQFCTVGELVLFQHTAGSSMHVPPFVILPSGINMIAGLNRVGIMRSGLYTPAERAELKHVFRLFYRRRDERTMSDALQEAEAAGEWGRAATQFLDFIRNALAEQPPRRRGVCGPARQHRSARLPQQDAVDA